MKGAKERISIKLLSATIAWTGLTAIFATLPLPVTAITFVTDRTALQGNDQVNWSSLGPTQPFNFLQNSFTATSVGGLGLNVYIPPAPTGSGITPPFVFQTLPPPSGIPTNFASGDFVLFTGLRPGTFPAVGNPGPLSITFAQPVLGAGTQIAVDDTTEFTAFIQAFDVADNLLGSFQAFATSSTALDNSAIFLGITNDTANISRLVFYSSVPNRAVGINSLSIVANRSVPEPSLIIGLLALATLAGSSKLISNGY